MKLGLKLESGVWILYHLLTFGSAAGTPRTSSNNFGWHVKLVPEMEHLEYLELEEC